ncbi:MAG TPA: hypothetical protein VMR25_07850 [Planctomycetaceae bacterium]|nr:hypothetical protein [Planctomycetaceae bacterium]
MDRREFCRAWGAGLAAALLPGAGRAEELRGGVLYPKRIAAESGKFSWYEAVLKNIPPLKHGRGSRWPLVAWEGFSNEPQQPEFYHQLLARGLTQHIRLDPKLIETAFAIQRAGSPVIVIEGGGGTFPASLAGDPSTWAHQFDAGYKPKDYTRPCPSLHAGWAIFADQLRNTLRQFKQRGVQIDAVWNDWEGDPLYGADRYDQAVHCKRCREILPPKLLASRGRFMDYTARKFYELFGAYYAAPVLEFYPKCSVTNWLAQPSTPEEPQPGWSDERGHIYMPPLVTAWNPTAYGAASWIWESRSKHDKRDQEHVDQVYTNVLLRQVSLTGKLTRRWAPENEMIPWICRWVSEPPELEFPVMSRERYREVLRHLWLRGVAAMQIFSPRTKNYEDMAVPEIQDAVAIYDEMLAFREFLDKGEVLSYDIPHQQDDGVVWSGLRLGNRAVVRVFKQGGGKAKQTLRPWGQKAFELEADGAGQTFLLDQDGAVHRA